MDFLKLLKQLNSHKVEFVVAGGYASMLLGSDILTQDLDICVNQCPENWKKIYKSLIDFRTPIAG